MRNEPQHAVGATLDASQWRYSRTSPVNHGTQAVESVQSPPAAAGRRRADRHIANAYRTERGRDMFTIIFASFTANTRSSLWVIIILAQAEAVQGPPRRPFRSLGCQADRTKRLLGLPRCTRPTDRAWLWQYTGPVTPGQPQDSRAAPAPRPAPSKARKNKRFARFTWPIPWSSIRRSYVFQSP